MKKQSGFTLIELIVVILILGILGATALPKFVSVENEAQVASHKGVAGAWTAAVMLSHAKWLALGKPVAGGYTIDTGTDVHFNTAGWPLNVSGTVAVDCPVVWALLLQANAPTATAAATSDYDTSASAGTNCSYSYTGTTTPGDLDIQYETSTGIITVDRVLDGA